MFVTLLEEVVTMQKLEMILVTYVLQRILILFNNDTEESLQVYHVIGTYTHALDITFLVFFAIKML